MPAGGREDGAGAPGAILGAGREPARRGGAAPGREPGGGRFAAPWRAASAKKGGPRPRPESGAQLLVNPNGGAWGKPRMGNPCSGRNQVCGRPPRCWSGKPDSARPGTRSSGRSQGPLARARCPGRRSQACGAARAGCLSSLQRSREPRAPQIGCLGSGGRGSGILAAGMPPGGRRHVAGGDAPAIRPALVRRKKGRAAAFNAASAPDWAAGDLRGPEGRAGHRVGPGPGFEAAIAAGRRVWGASASCRPS